MRRGIVIGSIVWAIVGASIALSAIGAVNDDALPLVLVASVLGPLCALVGALLAARQHDRVAGAALMLSAATPTYFAAALNLPAAVVGTALLLAPTLIGVRPA